MFFGQYASGTLASVQTSDTDTYQVQSAPTTAGQVAGVTVTLGVAQSVANLRSATLNVDANGPIRAANQIYLWNYSAGRYDLVRSTALRAAGVNRASIRLSTNLVPYVQGGEMKVLLRAVSARRQLRGTSGQPDPFTLGVNFVELRTRAAQ